MTEDALKRAARTLLQVSFVTAVLQLLVAFGVPLNAPEQAAIVAVATPLVSAAQNALEDRGAVPAVLK